MLQRGRAWCRRTLCRLTRRDWPCVGGYREEPAPRGHHWGHPKTDPTDPQVMLSECQRLCGAVRKLRLDGPNGVRVVYGTADPAIVALPRARLIRRAS